MPSHKIRENSSMTPSTSILLCIILSIIGLVSSASSPLPKCASCGGIPSDLSFCKNYVPTQGNICIPDKYLEVEKNISNIYDSTNQFLPFESSCRDAWKNYACARAFPRCTVASNGTSDIITPYEICYSVCKQYAYNCWARDGGAINWAIQPIWDVATLNKKLDYFCSQEVGTDGAICSLGGRKINGGNSIWNSNSITLILSSVIGFSLLVAL